MFYAVFSTVGFDCLLVLPTLIVSTNSKQRTATAPPPTTALVLASAVATAAAAAVEQQPLVIPYVTTPLFFSNLVARGNTRDSSLDGKTFYGKTSVPRDW
uniref:Secreted protein n=1 Tax=Vespula pensylvanica TaxID=30213 RepID=A0A834UE73_VESPE|nr:hypothetical protein H0235_002870 [Vespula pensylvanica]